MVNQMCVITPGPVALNTSWTAPGAIGQRSLLPPVLSKLDCFSDLYVCARAYCGRNGSSPEACRCGACAPNGSADDGEAATSVPAVRMPCRKPRRSFGLELIADPPRVAHRAVGGVFHLR